MLQTHRARIARFYYAQRFKLKVKDFANNLSRLSCFQSVSDASQLFLIVKITLCHFAKQVLFICLAICLSSFTYLLQSDL